MGIPNLTYRGLINGVLNAIDILTEAGYGDIVAYYNDDGESYTWDDILYAIQQEYERRKREEGY